MISRLRIIVLVVLAVLMVFFWNSIWLTPLKMFVVLVHEICHALAALISGGQVNSIVIHLDESGVTHAETAMDARFIFIVSAGYIGSTMIGGFLLNRGLKNRHIIPTMIGLGFLILIMSIFFVMPASEKWGEDPQALISSVFGIAWGIFFLAMAGFGARISRSILILVGSLSSLYCLFDLGDFIRGVEQTDAGILAGFLLGQENQSAESLQLMAWLIGFIWASITLAILFWLIRHALHNSDHYPSSAYDDDEDYMDDYYPDEDSEANYASGYYPQNQQSYYQPGPTYGWPPAQNNYDAKQPSRDEAQWSAHMEHRSWLRGGSSNDGY